nr:hypothetical protein [Tanacetum cinerariifolium]
MFYVALQMGPVVTLWLDACVDLTGLSPLTQTGMLDFIPKHVVTEAAQRNESSMRLNMQILDMVFSPFSFSFFGNLKGMEDNTSNWLRTVTIYGFNKLITVRLIVVSCVIGQTDDELTEKEAKQMEVDDQAIQTILMGLPEYIYTAVDNYNTAQEIWLHVEQMMKCYSIGAQEKKAKLFNE